MIIVQSGNTTVATFETFEQLVKEFNPKFGLIQDYMYADTINHRYISWAKVQDAKRNIK